MFEREIKFIYDFNLNKVNKLGPYFTFEQLLTVDLHPAILHYISAEIDFLVFEDRQKLLKNSVFDYSGEKINYHFGLITEELKKSKRFSLEYIAKLILHSTSFTVNFLVRPKWTLTRFIFDDIKHKTTNEIKQILNYIYYYKFLKKIIITYINSKKILSMNVEEFDELLHKTDKLSLDSNLSGVLSSSLISMAEFFNIGQMQKTRIPITAVELFLEEKDLPLHLQRITDTFGSDENASFYIGDYMKIINSTVSVKEVEEEFLEQQVLFNEQEEKVLDESVLEEETETVIHEAEEDIIVNTNLGGEEFHTDAGKDIEEFDVKPNDEIKITEPTKFRINIKDQNKVEPIDEALLIEREETTNEIEDEPDSFSSIIHDEKTINDEIVAEENEISLEEEEEFSGFSENEIEELQFGNTIDSVDLIKDEKTEIEESGTEEQIEKYFEEKVKELEDSDSVTDNLIENDDGEIEDSFFIKQKESESPIENTSPKLDLTEVLENKNMTRIIEIIFDYDIEDFANTLDEVSHCKNVDDAFLVINETLSKRKINRNSKEAESLREIIAEYFDQ